MLNPIISKDIADYLDDIHFTFTDFQKATLIYNRKDLMRNDMLNKLWEIEQVTDDQNLKSQIKEQLKYEFLSKDYIEEIRIDENDSERFEYHFIYFPTYFRIGDPVQNVRTKKVSVLIYDMVDQKKLIENAARLKQPLMYFDSYYRGYTIENNGIWKLEWLDPTELEIYDDLNEDMESVNSSMQFRAMAIMAMSDFLTYQEKGRNTSLEEQKQLILKYTKLYSDSIYGIQTKVHDQIKQASSLDHIILDEI